MLTYSFLLQSYAASCAGCRVEHVTSMPEFVSEEVVDGLKQLYAGESPVNQPASILINSSYSLVNKTPN